MSLEIPVKRGEHKREPKNKPWPNQIINWIRLQTSSTWFFWLLTKPKCSYQREPNYSKLYSNLSIQLLKSLFHVRHQVIIIFIQWVLICLIICYICSALLNIIIFTKISYKLNKKSKKIYNSSITYNALWLFGFQTDK